jgi:IS30 family transposase
MPKGYHHVTRDQRCQIYALKSMGFSQRIIAKQLELHSSTISREIKRNSGNRGYRYNQANHKATERRAKASRAPKKLNISCCDEIKSRLIEGWSPDQIAGRFGLENKSISHETIYRHVWQDKHSGGTLYKHLRRHGKHYNKRASGKSGRGCIPGRVDIKERPAIIETKSRIGDWEGDTIVGAKHQMAIISYVDRCSKFTLLEKIESKTAELVRCKTIERMSKLPHPVHSITYDNGKEFSAHQAIAEALKTKCYFATPYHSWERGLNEHTNGLVRQYIAKSSDLALITAEEIQAIENRLNNRPRKVLNYKTPFEIFFGKPNSSHGVALQC